MQKLLIKKRELNTQINWPETLHPLLQRIYSGRKIQSIDELDLSLSKLLPPDDLKNIHHAVELLTESLNKQHSILVVGDFDADGATSSALLIRVLRRFGFARVDYLVPNRFAYGYGLTTGIVKEALENKPDLIITVDNGISSLDGVALAKANGVKVLVTDHHLPGEKLPDADVIVNPNQPEDGFSSKSLAGVGVVFYLLVALRRQLREINWFEQEGIQEPNLADYLDIVALGTVADVVPLDRNNRILVNEGLKRIRAGCCVPGIAALLQVANKNPESLVASDLGFAIGPRLNAAGRLDDMSLGIECLLADGSEAYDYASQLDSLNRERREIETGMKAEAMQYLETLDVESDSLFGLALYDESWHQGVIGILASRVKDRVHRPVIIFAPGDEGEIKGSARSIPGIHIRDVLEIISAQNPGLIIKFGGHAMAAGLTILEKDFEDFSRLLNDCVQQVANDEILENVLHSDGEVSEEYLNLAIVEMLNQAGPWGQAFPEPMFTGHFRLLNQRILKERHLKVELAPVDSTQNVVLDGIVFNLFDETNPPREIQTLVELVYKLSINEFRGHKNIQILIEHILEAEHA
jgi:single-stranded-DNA-specific exonuclease